jgi:plasmid replication initiation protein
MSDIEKFKSHKSKELVECRFSLGIIEQKTLDLAISKINPKSEELQNPYVFYSHEFEDLAGITSDHSGGKVLKVMKRLRETTILKQDRVKGSITGFGLITKFKLRQSSSSKSIKCEVWFDDELKADLLAQQKYSEKELGVCFKISGKWTYKIYEILNQWKASGKCKYGYLEFRDMIGLATNSYTHYSDFRKRILKPAVAEIDDVTNISVEFDILLVKDAFNKNIPDEIEFFIRTSPPKHDGERVRKKGRKRKEKVETSQVYDHLDDIYPKDLQDRLLQLGVTNLKTLKDDGLTSDIWTHTLNEEPSKQPHHLVTTAKRIRDQVIATNASTDKLTEKEDITKRNQEYWKASKHLYPSIINRAEETIIHATGGHNAILFSDPDFLQLIEVFKVQVDEEKRLSGDDRRQDSFGNYVSGQGFTPRSKDPRRTE